MKKYLYLIIFSLCPLLCNAQTIKQEAIVKTRGRLDNNGNVQPGEYIANAIVELKNGTRIISDLNGFLAFSVSADKGYYITRVHKNGYKLADWDIINKLQYYNKVPLDILLENTEEKFEYERMIERKIRKNYHAQLYIMQERIDSLEKLKNKNLEYIRQLQDNLDKSYRLAEESIKENVKRYVSIDFDRADDFKIKFGQYILNGELDKADSLLPSSSKIKESVRKNIMSQKNAIYDMNTCEKYCYGKFEIASQRHQRDTAAYYLELRSELDFKNIQWQIEAAEYILRELSDVNRALKILDPTLEYCIGHHGEYHFHTAHLYMNKADACNLNGNYKNAMEYLEKALKIHITIYGRDSEETALVYALMGNTYMSNGEPNKALENYNTAYLICSKYKDLEIQKSIINQKIGTVYFALGNFQKHIEACHESLKILESKLGSDNPVTSTCYMNLAQAYYSQGNLEASLKYAEQYIDTQAKYYDSLDHRMIGAYHLLGEIYKTKGQTKESEKHLNKASEIAERIYGNTSIQISEIFNTLGDLYMTKGNYAASLDYYQKSYTIQLKHDKGNYKFALICEKLGKLYHYTGNPYKSLEYYKTAINILENTLGKKHFTTASVYNGIGSVYSVIGDLTKALDFHNKALDITKELFGSEHSNVAMCYAYIGAALIVKKNYTKALDLFTEAARINEKTFGVNNLSTADSYNWLGQTYEAMNNQSSALEHYKKALTIYENLFGENYINSVNVHASIGNIYINRGEFDKSVKHMEKAIYIAKMFLDINHPVTMNCIMQLAMIYNRNGEYQKALDLSKEAFSISKIYYGQTHEYTKKIMSIIEDLKNATQNRK